MIEQKDRNFYQLSEREKEFSKSSHHWLAQYDEEDDFLCEKVTNSLPGSTQEE
jgi:hypothetical protein